MKEHGSVYPVIICGGAGTRLWPASQALRPKQFISLFGNETLFSQTIRRVQGIGGCRHLVVVTGNAHASLVVDQLRGAAFDTTVLLEPEGRGSAPAMAAAASWIASRDRDAVAVFVASDHYIPDAEAFAQAVDVAVAAARHGRIVTLGIKPTKPNTGYGYIQPDKPGSASGVVAVSRFVEKPNHTKGEEYVANGYLWNSGNFVAKVSTLLAELKLHAPDVEARARQAVGDAELTPMGSRLGTAFIQAPNVSIDYAVMEKSSCVSVLPATLQWTDLGAWDQVLDVMPRDADGNATTGRTILLDTQDSLVRAAEGVTVVALGVRKLAIVAVDNHVLVSDLGSSQMVKSAVEQLAKLVSVPAEAQNNAATEDLGSQTRHFRTWLFTQALPLWWCFGADHPGWGFHESLSLGARPAGEPRRNRVQARQTYAFATAGGLGWDGPWHSAVDWGIVARRDHYRRPDGLFRALVGPDGTVPDDTVSLYDQAFILLALASTHEFRQQSELEAMELLDAIEVRARHVAAGFRERGGLFRSKAHRLLLEAALAWMQAGARPRWRALASEIVELTLELLIDPQQGCPSKAFTAGRHPFAEGGAEMIEPGQQFQWSWLLERWSQLSGDGQAANVALGLYNAGQRGDDVGCGVAVDVIRRDPAGFGVACGRNARSWPQTGRLKAALLLCERATAIERVQFESHALQACGTLRRHLDLEIEGLWSDKSKAEGEFAREAVPASALYHVVSAIQQLHATTGLHARPDKLFGPREAMIVQAAE